MDLNLDKCFIIKSKKLKNAVLTLNTFIEDQIKKSSFYEEDKEYFYFPNLKMKITMSLKIKKPFFVDYVNFAPKLIILKSKTKINDYFLEKDEWLIIPFDLRDHYVSESTMYVFALS